MVDIPFTTYAYPTTSRPTSRTTPARFAEVFNVMDFGALGNGSGDALSTRYGSLAAAQAVYPFVTSLSQTLDWAAIQGAINALWASPAQTGTVYIPTGNYNVGGDAIHLGRVGGANTSGSFVGGGTGTFISGNIPNGFVAYQSGGDNGFGKFENLTFANTSTWIASGGLRINNSTAVFNNVAGVGMIGILFPWNIFNASLNHTGCGCNADPTTGYLGTLGFAGFTPNIHGWRTTSPMQTAIQVSGSNSSHIDGCGIENCVTAILLGTFTGWASHCTAIPDPLHSGFSILTVAGTLGTDTGNPEFNYGFTLFGRGLAMPAWGSDPNDATGGTTITSVGTDGMTGSGYLGTYQINGTYTITTPIPIWTRSTGLCAGITVRSIQTEACFHTLYLNSVAGCHVSGVGCGSNPVECVNQFGIPGLTPRAPYYIKSASSTTLSGCGNGTAACYLGGIYIDPTAGTSSVTFESCISQQGADNVATGSISGNIMTITTFTSGASLGVGMRVTGSGVTAGTVITGSLATEPLTETVTITIASPAVFTTVSAHGFAANTKIMLYNGSNTLPTGLAIRTIYYVITSGMTATTFKLSASAGPGSAINTSGTQSGTHYLDRLDGSHGLSGYNATGTWRVNNSQTVGSEALAILTGPDWVMPTATASKTGLKFINCSSTGATLSGLNNLAMTFTCLPGESGASPYIPRVEGQEFNIVDGAKLTGGTAAIGDATQGGGTQHIKVWWNGTSWIRCG